MNSMTHFSSPGYKSDNTLFVALPYALLMDRKTDTFQAEITLLQGSSEKSCGISILNKNL